MATLNARLTQGRWFTYQGKEIVFSEDRHNPEYELDLRPGEVYGVLKSGKRYTVWHKTSLKVEFTLYEAEAKRLIQHSTGWTGKVRGFTVNAGKGGMDKKPERLPKGLRKLEIDSSNLKTAEYDEENQTLFVTFHTSDAKWAYEKVTPLEAKEMEAAPSQGRYFIYRIRDVKPQYRVGGSDAPSTIKPGRATGGRPDLSGQNTGIKKEKLGLTASQLSGWRGAEQGSYEDSNDNPKHAYAILNRGQVQDESELLTLLKSLGSNTFSDQNPRSFKNAANAMLKLAENYPFTERGKKQSTALIANIRRELTRL